MLPHSIERSIRPRHARRRTRTRLGTVRRYCFRHDRGRSLPRSGVTQMSAPNTGQKAAADIAALLRARNPLIWITTREEARTERLLMDAAQAAAYEPRFWDCACGITDFAGTQREAGSACTDPAQVLATIRDSSRRQVWILRDMPPWFKDPTVSRAMRTLARQLTMAPRDEARAEVMCGRKVSAQAIASGMHSHDGGRTFSTH